MRRLRTTLILLILAIPAGVFASTSSDLDDDLSAPGQRGPEGGPRVRAVDARAKSVVQDGVIRSATTRALISQLERYDVIAYVTMQPALRGRLAGSLTWVVSTGKYRYVRVSLSPELTSEQLVATLAHELQHVLEVAETPAVVDAVTLTGLYRRIGVASLGHAGEFDTLGARRIGDQVRQELITTVALRIGDIAQLER